MLERIAFNPLYPDIKMPDRKWVKGEVKCDDFYDWQTRQCVSFLWIIKKNDPLLLTLRYCTYSKQLGGNRIYCKDVKTNGLYEFTFSEWDKVMKKCTLTNGEFSGNFIFVKKGAVYSLFLV